MAHVVSPLSAGPEAGGMAEGPGGGVVLRAWRAGSSEEGGAGGERDLPGLAQ